MQLHTAPILRYAFGVGLSVASLTGCSIAESELSDSESLGSTEQSIINGTVPAHGALMDFGVVLLNRCTGTLLTNQHVLTAHHCVRDYLGNNNWAAATQTGIRAVLDGPTSDQSILQSRIIEPPQPWTMDAGDYAIIELRNPMEFNGRTDGYFRRIFSQADSVLARQTVNCIGYGATSEATAARYASGFGILNWANMEVSSVGTGTYTRNRQTINGLSVVGFHWDSGSTCFLNGEITGVQSSGSWSWVDSDGDGVNDGWLEATNMAQVTSASAGSFRAWVRQQIMADASIAYDFVPALPTTPTVKVAITTPEHVVSAEVSGSWTGAEVAPRSSRMDVATTSEPAFMMCPTVSVTTPLQGAAAVRVTCLSDALLPVILG